MKLQKGFTIIELMIATVIGVFLLIAVGNLIITVNKSVTLSDGLSKNQETGRFAMEYITRFARMAGYSDTQLAPQLPLNLQNGCAALPCSINDHANALGDVLSINYYVSTFNPVNSCSGVNIPANSEVSNVFWVEDDGATEGHLVCRTFSRTNGGWLDPAPVSLITNLDALEYQVGVSATPTDRVASRYINLDSFFADPSIDATHIRSIRVAVLANSFDDIDPDKVQSDSKNRKYGVLDAEVREYDDSYLRAVFSNTIEFPNAIETAINNE